MQQIFAWYTDPRLHLTLYGIAKRLNDDHIPTPRGGAFWSISTLSGMLRSPVYVGTAYSERTHFIPARNRASRTRPVGGGHGTVPAPVEEWVAVAVPAIIAQETFDAAQVRLAENQRLSPRNNTAHDYLLRGLVNCGTCLFTCVARTVRTYAYYACRGRRDALRATTGERCTARAARAPLLDAVVWEDLCRMLREPGMITHELKRARGGAWLPQALQARRKTVMDALNHLRRQQDRLLEVYLAEVIEREEFERKRQDLTRTQEGLNRQLRQLEAQVQDQMDTASLAEGIEAFCERVQGTLDQLTFAERRQLVELLIDCVIVSGSTVEIRYVVPTSQKGEGTPFCHSRSDHIRLINAPFCADSASMDTGSFAEQWKKALDPTIDRTTVHDEATFREPLDDVGLAQAVANVPADSQGDHVVREAMMGKGPRRTGSEATSALTAAPALSAKSGLSILTCPLALTSNASHNQSFHLSALIIVPAHADATKPESVPPYQQYSVASPTLDTSWNQYTFTFEPAVTNPDAMLAFNLAAATGHVWIDNVVISHE